MSFRYEKSKLRPQPPRMKDTTQRTRERSRNHDAKGRFTAGNDAPRGRKIKQLLKRQLGADATNAETEQLTADVLATFRALCRSMGSDEPAVQDTLARRARWGVLSARYALRALEVGLDTPDGMKLVELALKLDARAERLDVTAIDLANRLGGTKPAADPHKAMLEAFGQGGSK